MPRSPVRPASRQGGQASVEYVGLVGIIAVLVAVTVGVAVAAGVPNAILREFRHALCVVTGHGCETLSPAPCAVRSREVGIKADAKVLLVGVGRKAALTVIQKSDGTVDVIELDLSKLGGDVGAGAEGRLSLGKNGLSTKLGMSGEVAGSLAVKRLWHVKDLAEAYDLVNDVAGQLAVKTGGDLPIVGGLLKGGAQVVGLRKRVRAPDLIGFDAGVKGLVEAGIPGVDVKRGLEESVGTTKEVKDGHVLRTATFALSTDVAAALGGSALGESLSATGEGSAQLTWRDGELVTLKLLVNGQGSGSGVLGFADPDRESPPGSKPMPGGLKRTLGLGVGESGRRLQVAATLDLTRPENRDAVLRLTHALRPTGLGDLPGAVRGLAGRVAQDGMVDVSRYTTSSKAYGGGASVSAGLKLGGDLEVTDDSRRLADAWTRMPGGLWERRVDCLEGFKG